jgi:hypothetical protein
MKRLGRWLFNFAAGVSMVMCVATAALWARSLFVTEEVVYQRTDPLRRTWLHFWVASTPGRIFITHLVYRFDADGQAEKFARNRGEGWHHGETSDESDEFPFWRTLGFRVNWTSHLRQGTGTINAQQVSVPHWFVLLLSAIVPGLWAKSWLRQRVRLRKGLCLACGYDLRATPQRCPECGTVPAKQRMKGSQTQAEG